MPEPNRWEIVLGRLGSFLAAQDADHVEILDQGGYFDVSWHLADGSPQERLFVETELANLRPPTGLSPAFMSPLTLLAHLGHEIDQELIDVARIAQEADAFVVTGSIQGQYSSRRYPFSGLSVSGAPAAEGQHRPSSSVTRDSSENSSMMASQQRHASPLRDRLQQLQR